MIIMMCGHHSIIYPIPIIIFSTLNAECETEWSISLCVFAVFDISCTNTLNTATFIDKQLDISVVYNHHWAINIVF